MTLISKTAELAEFCEHQRAASYVTVDTEFLRDNSYWPKLCVVQVAGPEDAIAIDALSKEMDLAPLFDLLFEPKILKVMHAARQDMEIFFHETGKLPAPLFDTQVAAMVCGFGDSVAYDVLVRNLTGAHIDKASRFTDWSRRPLKKQQIDYAISDVTHLRRIYEKLARQLEKSGRAAWLEEEMSILTSPGTYRLDPETAWKRLKTRSHDPRYLAVLREVAAWREEEAQTRNVPRNRVLRDEQLYDIAAHRPATAAELAHTRGIDQSLAQGRIGKQVLKAVDDGLQVPEEDCPRPRPRREIPQGIGPLMDLLKVLLKLKCEEAGVAQKLVANTADLERIAAGEREDLPVLQGWRRQIFGEDALKLLDGRLGLFAHKKRIKPIEIDKANAKATKT